MYEPTYDLIRLILAPRMEEKLSEYGVRYKYNKSENIIYTATSGIGDFVLRLLIFQELDFLRLLLATFCGNRPTYEADRSEEASHADLAWATMHALYNEPITGENSNHRNIIEVF
ncbi:oxidoreductase [Xenorhabdus sp. TS4]|nr:oxidoreductase [Xenorhabdus sp. TS4]